MSAKLKNDVDHVSMSARWCLPGSLALVSNSSTALLLQNYCRELGVGVCGRDSLSQLHLKLHLILSRSSSLFLAAHSRYSTAFVQVCCFTK